MNPAYLLVFFGAHWVGDFLLQTSAMARNKSKSILWLTLHVGVYSIVLLLFSIPVLPFSSIALFIAANGALHWITDFFTSKLTVQYKDRPRIFYSIIGIDQMIHYGCLTFTFFRVAGLI